MNRDDENATTDLRLAEQLAPPPPPSEAVESADLDARSGVRTVNVAEGTRWKHRRSKRVAFVVSVDTPKVGYRYEKAVERHHRVRNKPHVQTCWVTVERFLKAFAPAKARS